MSKIKISKAIVSVSDKALLEQIGNYFLKFNITVLSTGGTYNFLKKRFSKLKLMEISSFTSFKEILDGRVKTLHPLVHAGILAKKDNPSHLKQLKELKISIDQEEVKKVINFYLEHYIMKILQFMIQVIVFLELQMVDGSKKTALELVIQ